MYYNIQNINNYHTKLKKIKFENLNFYHILEFFTHKKQL